MKRNEIPRIFRILLRAKDLDRSHRFYESLLAAPGRRVGGGRVYFDCGPVILAVLDASAEGDDGDSPPTEVLYFATGDLEAVHNRARKLGCLAPNLIHNDPANPAGEMVMRPWGERSFYATDPSGNPLCFVDEGTLFTGTARPLATLQRAFGGRRAASSRRTKTPTKIRRRS